MFHAADDEWKRRWQDYSEPHMQPFRSHGQGRPAIDWRDIAHPCVGSDHHRPERTHDHDKQHRGFALSEPKQGQRDPADAGQRLQTERHCADGVMKNFPSCGEQPERETPDNADEIAGQEAAHRDQGGMKERSIFGSVF